MPTLTTSDLLAKLTPRERDVSLMITRGKSNKEIACDLGLSRKTVEVHASNLFRKVGVSSRLELACKLLGALPADVLSRRTNPES